MTHFSEIAPVDIATNAFQLVGREWMLITAGSPNSHNTMTASWGNLGYLWNMDVAICYVRPQRHTFGFIERSAVYTLSFFGAEWRSALDYCGSHSGRDVDKAAQTGLTPFETPGGAVSFEQARLVLECRKLYAGNLAESDFVDRSVAKQMYPNKDFHRFYVGHVQRVLSR